MVECVRYDAQGTLCDPNFGNDEITRKRLEQWPFVASLLLFAADVQVTTEADLGDDVQHIERSLGAVDGLDSSGNEITQRALRKRPGVRRFLILDPALNLPPPPDHAAEGSGKFGVVSGAAPLCTQASNARSALSTSGNSFAPPSPVSPVE